MDINEQKENIEPQPGQPENAPARDDAPVADNETQAQSAGASSAEGASDVPAIPILAEASTATPEQPAASAPPRHRRSRIREDIEAIILAIIFVIVIREYVAEAYKIPTGSMEPTLMGDSVSGRGDGDNIIVDKMYYWFNPVKRWDVVVFKYPKADAMSLAKNCDFYRREPEPAERAEDFEYCVACHRRIGKPLGDITKMPNVVLYHRNFIKRLVALPGETIRIKHGDIYITNDSGLDDEIPPKPADAQDALWQRVFFCDFGLPHPLNENRWRITNKAGVSFRDGRLVAEATASSPVILELPEIKDWRIDERNEIIEKDEQQYGKNYVGDIMIEAAATFIGKNSSITLEIVEDSCLYTASLGSGGSSVSWRLGEEGFTPRTVTEQVNFIFVPDTEYRIRFINVDDRLTLAVNGKPVWGGHHFAKGEIPTPETTAGDAAARIDIKGGKAIFSALNIYRDIYYTASTGGNATRAPYYVPEGQYFVLGDNSPISSDSRVWETFPRANLIGRACFVFFPFHPIIDTEKMRLEWRSRLKLIR